MPKRSRSRFEAIPQSMFPDDDLNNAPRSRRRLQRIYNTYLARARGGNEEVAFRTAAADAIRSFGIRSDLDRGIFAEVTGRLQFIQRWWVAVLDRRRRQAYLILRRFLPIEVAGPISIRQYPTDFWDMDD